MPFPISLTCITIKPDTMEEVWKDIKGYEGIYQVSSYGNVKRIKKSKGTFAGIIKPYDRNGYFHVCLCNNNGVKKFKLHRIVASAFLTNIENKPYVNHIDGDRKNNNINNLEWCTPKENCIHAYATGLQNYETRKGVNRPCAKLNDEAVKDIRAKYVPKKVTHKQLGNEYGVSANVIKQIIKLRIWKHVV